MSFNVIGSLRVYLDAPREGDPRTFLAVLYEGEERVHPFDADGVSTDQEPLEALIRNAKGARVVANEADRLWAGTFFELPPSRVLPLPPSEEARLRLLAGRARKADPYRPAPAPSGPSGDVTPGKAAEGLPAVDEPPDDHDDPKASPTEDPLDDMEGWEEIFADLFDESPETSQPPEEPDPTPDGAGEDGSQSVHVYPVLSRDLESRLGLISDSFSSRIYHDRALSAALAELQEAAKDPSGAFRPGRHELHEVRLRRDVLSPDRHIAIAWTERVEDRCRLRMVRFSDAADLVRYQEEAMRRLMDRVSRYERGPIEALLPSSLAISPPLMRAGGFVHQLDLPRWCWGEDCALWVRS